MFKVNEKITDFELEAFVSGEIKKVKLSDYRGKWVALVFYPADFTFVCPTELGELADNQAEFDKLGAQVLSASCDTAFVHKAWFDNSPTISKIKFPMLADPTGKLARAFGVYIEEDGMSLRGTFIINSDGVLKAFEVHDNAIGRSTKELLRKIAAAKFVNENAGLVCPASWTMNSSAGRSPSPSRSR